MNDIKIIMDKIDWLELLIQLESKHMTRLNEYLKLYSFYFYFFMHIWKIKKILQVFQVLKVYDKYHQSSILQRKLNEVFRI